MRFRALSRKLPRDAKAVSETYRPVVQGYVETISHIQNTHVRFPAACPRHGRVAPCERCYRPLTGCITKLCKAPTCTINIFKSSTLVVRMRYGYVFIQVVPRATSVSRGARTISSYPLFLSKDMRAREPWKHAARVVEEFVRPSALSNSEQTPRHLFDNEVDVCPLCFPYRLPCNETAR